MYHYIANIEKQIRHYGYSQKNKKREHDEIIKFFVGLLFIKNINNKINEKN